MALPPKGYIELPVTNLAVATIQVNASHITGFHGDPETGGSRVYMLAIGERDTPIITSLSPAQLGADIDMAQWQI